MASISFSKSFFNELSVLKKKSNNVKNKQCKIILASLQSKATRERDYTVVNRGGSRKEIRKRGRNEKIWRQRNPAPYPQHNPYHTIPRERRLAAIVLKVNPREKVEGWCGPLGPPPKSVHGQAASFVKDYQTS